MIYIVYIYFYIYITLFICRMYGLSRVFDAPLYQVLRRLYLPAELVGRGQTITQLGEVIRFLSIARVGKAPLGKPPVLWKAFPTIEGTSKEDVQSVPPMTVDGLRSYLLLNNSDVKNDEDNNNQENHIGNNNNNSSNNNQSNKSNIVSWNK